MMYFETLDALEELDSDDIAEILFAMRDYSRYGVIPDFPKGDTKSVLWKLIKRKLDADAERYEDIRKKRSEAGKKDGDNTDKDNTSKQELTPVNTSKQNQPTTPTTTPTTTSTTTDSTPNPDSKPSTNKVYKGDKEKKWTVNRPYTPQPSLDDMDKLLEEVERRRTATHDV